MAVKKVHRPPQLVPGTLYKGMVSGNLLPNNTLSVRINGFSQDVPCTIVSNIFSGLLGFKTSFVPAQKTKVLILYTGTLESYIIGSLPTNMVDPGNQSRTSTGPGAPSYHASQLFSRLNSKAATMAASHKPPVDLAEGEFQVDNMLGVALTFMRSMISLSAGDLARVECLLQDDMVRIISDTFKQYSAFGDYKISNDGGRLNVTWAGTSLDYEAWGQMRSTDPKVTVDANKNVDMSKVDGILDDGRWRFNQYVGWLGNFINLFVTDPVNNVGKIAEGQFRSGKARMHVNNDGSVLIQSVADIVLEKVVRIPIPNPIKLEQDPTGNRADAALKNTQYLKTWQPSNSENIFEMAFQLRDYARWLNNSYSLSRFYQMNQDYQVPTEQQTPAPDVNSVETDKAAVNPGITNWRIAYATIRIYRDGSYQNVDAYGNSSTSTAVGYYISTPRDLYLEAGGSINMVAGRDINLVAQKNVGISAITQAVRIKGQTAVMIFAAAGNVILEVVNSFIIKLIGTINANNAAKIDTSGNITSTGNLALGGAINCVGNVTAQSVLAALTDTIDLHSGHIFPGTPVPVTLTPDSTNFQFQTFYGGSPLYQTISQQMMASNDITSSGNWSFSGNTVAGKGSPWPGTSVTVYQPAGGASLNIPSNQSLFTNQPGAMDSVSLSIFYQT